MIDQTPEQRPARVRYPLNHHEPDHRRSEAYGGSLSGPLTSLRQMCRLRLRVDRDSESAADTRSRGQRMLKVVQSTAGGAVSPFGSSATSSAHSTAATEGLPVGHSDGPFAAHSWLYPSLIARSYDPAEYPSFFSSATAWSSSRAPFGALPSRRWMRARAWPGVLSEARSGSTALVSLATS